MWFRAPALQAGGRGFEPLISHKALETSKAFFMFIDFEKSTNNSNSFHW